MRKNPKFYKSMFWFSIVIGLIALGLFIAAMLQKEYVIAVAAVIVVALQVYNCSVWKRNIHG